MADNTSNLQGNLGHLYYPCHPSDWERFSLYSLAQWVNGLAFRDFQFTASGLPVIKIAEIKGGISGQTKFTQQTLNKSAYVTFGDLLFSWSGQPETSIDAFRWRGPDGWLNQHIFRVTPRDGIDRIFFYYLLRYLKPNFVGIARNKQTTGLGHVTKRDLENIQTAVPPLAEQRAIADILGVLDDKVEHNRQISGALERLAWAIFRAWFVDFEPVKAKAQGAASFPSMPQYVFDALPTRFVDSQIGPVPEGWDVGSLGDMIDIHDSRRVPLSRREREQRRGLFRYYGATGIIDYVNGFLFDGLFVLVGEDGTVVNNQDGPVVQYVWGKFWANNHAHVLTGSNGISTEYLRVLLDHINIRPFVTGAVQPKLNQRNLKSIPILIPPSKAAAAFDDIIAPFFALLRQTHDQSRELEAIRDLLLPQLLSGSVRVKVVNG